MDLKEIRKQFEDEKILQQDTGDATDTISESFTRTWATINKVLDKLLTIVKDDDTLTVEMEAKINALIDAKLSELVNVVFDDTTTGTYKIGQ